MRGIVPRIPAVPTGESILKLDSFLSFFTSTTISPRLRSMTVSEGLGSSLRAESFPDVLGSKLFWANFLMFKTEPSLRVVIVPEEKSSTTLDPAPVFTVCPSNNNPPTLIRSLGKSAPLSLFVTVTCPSMLAMMIAPLESIARKERQKQKDKKVKKRGRGRFLMMKV